jgi:SAM-dependent methyltransferase
MAATATSVQLIDQEKMEQFMGQVVTELGASISAALVVIGDRLGLYRAMAEEGPVTSEELAKATNTTERYVREWLINQAAGGYVTYDPESSRYRLTPEQASALANEDSPFFAIGGFQVITAMIKAEPRIVENFRSGEGMLWGEHDHSLFEGTERVFRPGYNANLVQSWIPALNGVHEKLARGATVADVGCGRGSSCIILAQAYPNLRVYGFDNHAPSITRAREAAEQAGVSDRVTFEVSSAQTYSAPLSGYDLIAYFACLHDMGDPIGACRHAYQSLNEDGTVLIVEPMAGDRPQDNFNPVGRIYAGASTLCCTPNALASGGFALGTVASEASLREVVTAGGFTSFRRATETPVNRVFEARR